MGRPSPTNIGHFKNLRGILLAAWIFCGFLSGAQAGDLKLSGLQFSVGTPSDKPAARVRIAEVTQGAQKRGFLRIALLPLVLAKGVEVRFLRPELAALGEVQETLNSMVKLETQEWHRVSLFMDGETAPRLTAEEAVPRGNVWELKRVRARISGEVREFKECTLQVSGEQAGLLTPNGRTESCRIDMEPAAGL
ncbi:MAG: hypothetical protein EBS01_00250 [Verrucomicrobia bacterium]|nr:hypothetical protein [Verrucomicrobiota bacterium]